VLDPSWPKTNNVGGIGERGKKMGKIQQRRRAKLMFSQAEGE